MLKKIFPFVIVLLLACSTVYAQNAYYINGQLSGPNLAQNALDDVKIITDFNSEYDLFTDHASGYKILVPKGSIADISMSTFRNTFTTNDLKVEIYYDDLTNKTASFYELIHYSNKFLSRGGLHNITAEYNTSVDGHDAYTAKWQRNKLTRVPDDKNFYMATSVKRTSQRIYTIVIKSAKNLGHEGETITKSFSFLPKQGAVKNYKTFTKSKTPMNDLTKKVFNDLFSPDAGLTWGIFEYSAPRTFWNLDAIERDAGYKFKVLLHYQSIDQPVPLDYLNNAWENDRIVELSLATNHTSQANALWTSGIPANSRVAYDILDGKYDDYFDKYAEDLKKFQKPILFRLNNEMNGDWCWYSAFYTARDADIYIKLWHYIKSIFDRHGVDNLIWIWNPHDVSRPDFAWNHFLAYYPGDEYVDIIGMTGYNNGTYFHGEKWRSFDQIYKDVYKEYSALFDKPFMLTEFSSSTFGGSKADWIDDMFNKIGNYPNIKVAVWWNGIDYDRQGNPGRIYLINNSPEVIAAINRGLSKYKSKVISNAKNTQEDMSALRRKKKYPEQP